MNDGTPMSDGDIHYHCFKREAAQGQEITLMSLSEDIARLKKRVQTLERLVELHDRSIDFRIGGSE